MKLAIHTVVFLLSNLLLSALVVQAAERPYYQGKNITFLINYAAGGPTDIEGRIVARHLAKHIPGNPTVIVQNMPGAGGVTGINFLGEVAKRDGLTMAYFTGVYNHQMMKNPTLRIDLMQVPYIASVGSVTVCYIRSDVPPGIKKPTDIAKAERFRAGGLSFDSNKDLRFRLAFDVLGLKYDYVTGYNSSSDARLAVQRNEIQYHDENIPGYRGVVEPQMVKTGMVTPLYYHDVIKPDGTMGKAPITPSSIRLLRFTRKLTARRPPESNTKCSKRRIWLARISAALLCCRRIRPKKPSLPCARLLQRCPGTKNSSVRR